MSIEINGLGKTFGTQKAVNNVSFKTKSGEILGFLGPNGAGKSTTMKMITGYFDATEGEVIINGQKMSSEATSLKSKIGYLPEHNPLYLDMYISEFLTFVASIYGFKGVEAKRKVEDIIETVGLLPEKNKKIGQLSKGYRQRVGLAQALIHDPEILILDEPTTGLDPNQLEEIRGLIKTIGKNKTVILSTHIMQEVEAICDRVIIINKGEIVADKPLEVLLKEYKNLEQAFKTLTQ